MDYSIILLPRFCQGVLSANTCLSLSDPYPHISKKYRGGENQNRDEETLAERKKARDMDKII